MALASSKPQRSPAEIEGVILRKIFLVSLTDSMEDDSRIAYLEKTAAEFLSEGKELRLQKDLMERVLVDRISRDFVSAEPPFDYLLGCYGRAWGEGKKIASMKDKNVRSEMELVVKEAKRLAVSYCRLHLGNPGMFPDWDSDKSNGSSPLLPLIFSEISGAVDGLGGGSSSSGGGISCPPGFLGEFFRDSDFDVMNPIFKKLYEDLRRSVLKVSTFGTFQFQEPLRALLYLVQFPVGAKSLVNHPLWIPKDASVNGRDVEMTSILGPFFHLSALPDHNDDMHLLSSSTATSTLMASLCDGLTEVLTCLLKNTNTRENVLEFLAEVINKNSSRAHLYVHHMTCASSGMFMNLSTVMLRLCEPFLDANLTKRDRIDYQYVTYGSRLDLTGLTALHASSEEIVEWLNKSKSRKVCQGNARENKSTSKFPFVCECFFMTARVLNLGLLKALDELQHLVRDIARCEDILATIKEQTPHLDLQLDGTISSLQQEIQLKSQKRQCYEAQIFRDGDLIRRALSFYRLMVVWLVGLAGGSKLPLPSTCPMEFASMPEHFVEDVMDLLKFSSYMPKTLNRVLLEDFMDFIIMFMASPQFIRSPYLRAKMVEVLNCWIPRKSGSLKTSALFEGHQLSRQYLVRNLLKLYVDVEFTGSHNQFYDKFGIRHSITKLLDYLWQVPGHHNAWRQIAKKEEKGVYLNFLNFLINDSIYLLDESLNKILELKEMENGTRHSRSQVDIIRTDMKLANENVNMLAFTSEQITSPFLLPEMVERVAIMLNYFLLQLVGPRRKSLSLTDPEKYEFRPKQLFKQIVKIYVNLARCDHDNIFPAAITADGRSYDEKLFSAAEYVLRRIGHDGRIIQEFMELGAKAKTAASEATDAEVALGDIPDEFLDPIQCTLMRDPVILPSGHTVDRPVIERHLLSAKTDPFSRFDLTLDMLIPNTQLKAKIDEFIESHEQQRRKT